MRVSLNSVNRRNISGKIVTLLAVVFMMTAGNSIHAQEQFKRGLEQYAFIPKGQWITGVSVSYSQSKSDNYQFLIIEGLNSDSYTFKLSPMVMYCFKDNLAAGGRFAYKRTLMRVDKAKFVLASDTDYSIDNLYSLSHSYSGMAAFRNYISFGDNKRFGMFNEVQLQLGGSQSKLCNGSGESLSGTYERSFDLDIGLAPGMIMFLNNYSAIEVNVGVLGFSYTNTKSTTDQIYVAHRNSQSANFKVNLFSITFGVAFYL